ncbi:MAG: O-antigen ligase family protein [Bacillota bacterium]|nr:O-antigen ligase family protein [Bacillota bacterium]
MSKNSKRNPSKKTSEKQVPTGDAITKPAAKFDIKTGAFILLGFLILMALTADFVKPVALSAVLITALIAFSAGTKKELEKRICAPIFAMAAYVFMGAVSTFYALSGKFALNEFCKIIISFLVYTAILFLQDGSETSVKKTMTLFSGLSALLSFFSIEAASARILYNGLCFILKPLGGALAEFGAYESGTRISSIIDAPNVFAGITALGTLFAVYLFIRSKNKKELFLSSALLGINALGFLLSFSMGATAVFIISALVYIALSVREERARVIVLMLETALITLLMSGLSYAGLGHPGEAVSFLPVAAAALEVLLLYFIHIKFGEALVAKLNKNSKAVLPFFGGVILLFILFAALALNITGAYQFSGGEVLRRGAYPTSGKYDITAESDKNVNVKVESQNREQVMMHISTVLYEGPAKNASFTVPNGSEAVYFNFSADGGTILKSASFSNPGNGKTDIKLKYLLLPEFISNRLQGLKANQNAIQRTVFFEDGMKLFYKSPIYGLGLGSFENAIKGVQEFYYETKYVHNHYIQMLVDEGIIGLAIFLFLILSSAYILIKNRKNRTGGDMFAVLFASLFMIAGHSAVEVVLSTITYLPFAFAVFALIVVSAGGDGGFEKKRRYACNGVRLFTAGFSLLFTVLLLGNITARNMAKSVNDENLFSQMDKAIKLDVYEKNDYLITYVVNSVGVSDETIKKRADLYADELSKVKSNTIQGKLIAYYFSRGKEDKAFEMAKESVTYTSSDKNSWIEAFSIFETIFDPAAKKDLSSIFLIKNKKDYYVKHILEIYDLLKQHNEKSMEKIKLGTRNNIFLSKIMEIKDLDSKKDLSAIMSVFSNELFDSSKAIDLDSNSVPDLITGNITGENGRLKLNGTAALNVNPKVYGRYRLAVECDHPEALTMNIIAPEVKTQTVGDKVYADFDINRKMDGSDTVIEFSGENLLIDKITLLRTDN